MGVMVLLAFVAACSTAVEARAAEDAGSSSPLDPGATGTQLAQAAPQGQPRDNASLSERVRALEQQLAATRDEAFAEEEAATKFHLAGYGHAGFASSDDEDDTFTAGAFNPMFHFQYRDSLLFESELQIETAADGETELEVEYSSLNYFAANWLVLRIGKWLSPVGQFQERLHPDWINKLPDAPAGWGHGGAQPLSDVGLQARGGVLVGDTLLTYALAAGNGPRLGHHGVELEGFGEDDNGEPSFAGRFAVVLPVSLELGVSWMTADVSGEPGPAGPVGEGDYDLVGADFALTRQFWEIRGEYLDSELGSFFTLVEEDDPATSLLPETEWTAWYLQGAYKLDAIVENPIANKLELVLRYGEFDIDGFEEFEEDGNEERLDVGVNYLLAPSLMFKLAVQRRDFTEPGRDDETRVLGELAFGF